MAFSIHTIYEQIFRVWRKKRFALFLKLIQPSITDTLLDVGGYPIFWNSRAQFVKHIDTLNINTNYWNHGNTPNYKVDTIIGDGCSLSMADQSYDIGFSNSVIEHVGTWKRQQEFASEICRVAKSIWVQTPAYEFPIEPHYLTPFIHYLPKTIQKRGLRWLTIWGWIQHPNQNEIDKMVETTRLLRKSEMKILFPNCEILIERILLVFPKSYIAFRK